MKYAVLLAVAGLVVRPAHADDELALGKKLFLQQATPACALCHTLRDAGSEGVVGPVLDELKPDAARVANALRNGLGKHAVVQGQAVGGADPGHCRLRGQGERRRALKSPLNR